MTEQGNAGGRGAKVARAPLKTEFTPASPGMAEAYRGYRRGAPRVAEVGPAPGATQLRAANVESK